ncbi:MAG: hypothetical protein HY735_37245 [Verrucomicrobia bacterium]|nr:hypothetical protein [Verrucomicrobiota bacterium]
MTTPYPHRRHRVQTTGNLDRAPWREAAGVTLSVERSNVMTFAVAKAGVSSEFYRVVARSHDLGVTGSYEVAFDKNFDFDRLARDGIKRVSLYFTWKEFEIGAMDPNDPSGASLAEDLDPIIQKLGSLGMKTCLIFELTETDCDEAAPQACWLEYGIPRELLYDQNNTFLGFDHPRLSDRLENFAVKVAQRYPSKVVTHLFIGNETDQFLRLHGYKESFKALLRRLNKAVSGLPDHAKFGTIFTYTPDSLSPNYNAMAREVAPLVEVMAFTIYPFLFHAVNDQKVAPAASLISQWFSSAAEVAAGKPFVVTETAHPANGDFGTATEQLAYVRLLIDYLKTTPAEIEFVSWWSIEDAETHPFRGFRHTGLFTNNLQEERPAYRLWTEASQ